MTLYHFAYFAGAVIIVGIAAIVADEVREHFGLRRFSLHIVAAEAIHFAVGFLFGICPWARPWSQLVGVAYILAKELMIDPRMITHKYFWWELEKGDRPYCWGRGWNQVLPLREKGAIDTAFHLLGQAAGTIIYELVFPGG